MFVSLPKSWVKRRQLKQHGTVMLVEQPDGSVAVYPEIKEGTMMQTVLSVAASETERSLRRRITGAYVDGFDIIRLKAIEPFTNDQYNAIRDTTSALFGLEIVELTGSLVTIQCLLTKTLPIEETLRRIHGMIDSKLQETIFMLKQENPQPVRDPSDILREVKRLSLVLHRLLRSQLLFPTKDSIEIKPIDNVDFLRVVDKITEISGSVKRITEASLGVVEQPPPRKIVNQLTWLCEKAGNAHQWSMEALISKDETLANRVLDQEMGKDFDTLWVLLKEGEKKISTTTFSYVHRILDDLKQIDTRTREIAEIAIDRAEEAKGVA